MLSPWELPSLTMRRNLLAIPSSRGQQYAATGQGMLRLLDCSGYGQYTMR